MSELRYRVTWYAMCLVTIVFLWLEGKSNMNSDISFFQSLCNTVECLTASAGLFIYPL
jgi:hypothetical protein